MSPWAWLGLLALTLMPAAGRAQFEDAPSSVEGSSGEMSDEERLAEEVRRRLAADPSMADSLAARLNRSTIADRISAASDPNQRLRDIRAWIEANPQDAAGLAVGLAVDDSHGTQDFEKRVAREVPRTHLVENPNAKNGIFGRLKKQGQDSKLLKAQAEDMSEEEKREILKTIFEGAGGQSNKVITQQGSPAPDKGSERPSGTGELRSGFYDRLSQANMRGYSPQLQSMQSALNQRRVPGAPKLIETGKLDYATLSYPAYGMRYDLSNLDRRLRYERNAALARLAGGESKYSSEELLDPSVEKKLEEAASGKTLPERFARRRAALERAAAAMRGFEATALPAKDPSAISRSLLMSLSDRQREAARWITVASLEEELQRLEAQSGFMTPDLIEMIHDCPIEESQRAAYLRRGEELQRAVATLRSDDEAAIAQLSKDEWLERISAVEALLGRNGALRKNLGPKVDNYRAIAYRFGGSVDRRPGWRRFVDDWLERLLPGGSQARALRQARAGRERLKDAFMKIAEGNFDAARTVLASIP